MCVCVIISMPACGGKRDHLKGLQSGRCLVEEELRAAGGRMFNVSETGV